MAALHYAAAEAFLAKSFGKGWYIRRTGTLERTWVFEHLCFGRSLRAGESNQWHSQVFPF